MVILLFFYLAYSQHCIVCHLQIDSYQVAVAITQTIEKNLFKKQKIEKRLLLFHWWFVASLMSQTMCKESF